MPPNESQKLRILGQQESTLGLGQTRAAEVSSAPATVAVTGAEPQVRIEPPFGMPIKDEEP